MAWFKRKDKGIQTPTEAKKEYIKLANTIINPKK